MEEDAFSQAANVVLHLDNGTDMRFSGRPFAGGSWFDEETGELTRQKLYATESGEHVYSIVTGQGQSRSRRAYRVALHGEACTISDGRTEMTLDLEMLMLAVRALLEKGPFPLPKPYPLPPKTFDFIESLTTDFPRAAGTALSRI